jgi:CBS domain-containing protein
MTDSDDVARTTTSERLEHIAQTLRAGEESPSVRLRTFLKWFGAFRRGSWIVYSIRSALKRASLITMPDFNSVDINASIRFALAPKVVEVSGSAAGHSTVIADAVLITEQESPSPVSIGIGDPTYRLSKLDAAQNKPLSIAPDKPLADAITLMLSNDYSQLPVMTTERTVKGIISWRSVGARLALGKGGPFVRDFMDEAFEIGADRSLFAALATIIQQDYVLVRDAEGKISGIVTTADLSWQFQQLTEPFLLLGEIENHVRRLMDGKYTKDELATAKDPGDTEREIADVSDLSFGEYVRFLQHATSWTKLGLPIERSLFVADLDAVRLIRNEVMHFDPDPLPPEALQTLRRVAKFLGALQSFGI